MQKLDAHGLKLIAQFEGVRQKAYLDSAGIATIGIGFIRYSLGALAGRRVALGDTMTQEAILAEFAHQVAQYERAVNEAVKVPLTQSQFNACVSLCYNIGIAAFSRSSVVRLLNLRQYRAACRAFALWNKAGGRTVAGLVKRREAEMREFGRSARDAIESVQ